MNRILVTSFASNVARMETIFYCAKNWKIFMSCWKIHAKNFQSSKKMWLFKNLIEPLNQKMQKNIAKNKILYLATGSQGEPMGAMNRIINDIHPEVF